jgi:lipoprotein signal peptidase
MTVTQSALGRQRSWMAVGGWHSCDCYSIKKFYKPSKKILKWHTFYELKCLFNSGNAWFSASEEHLWFPFSDQSVLSCKSLKWDPEILLLTLCRRIYIFERNWRRIQLYIKIIGNFGNKIIRLIPSMHFDLFYFLKNKRISIGARIKVDNKTRYKDKFRETWATSEYLCRQKNYCKFQSTWNFKPETKKLWNFWEKNTNRQTNRTVHSWNDRDLDLVLAKYALRFDSSCKMLEKIDTLMSSYFTGGRLWKKS